MNKSLNAGTKIFYDRHFLLKCRNSPLTKSPPANMAKIPGITTPGVVDIPKENGTQGAIQDENQKKRGNKEGERDKILRSSVIEPQGASF